MAVIFLNKQANHAAVCVMLTKVHLSKPARTSTFTTRLTEQRERDG